MEKKDDIPAASADVDAAEEEEDLCDCTLAAATSVIPTNEKT